MTTVVRRMPDVRQRRLASDTAFWGLIFADMTVFALFFVAYLWQFGSNRSEFQAYAAYLVVGLGLIDALILLTSSYLVVRAVQNHRAGTDAGMLIGWALLLAAAFAAVKSVEYAIEISAGHTLTSSTFVMYYFVLTGLHLMHVLIGGTLLLTWWRGEWPRRRSASGSPRAPPGTGAWSTCSGS